jgi:hypothetical protein
MALDPKSFQERRVYPDMRYIDDNMIHQQDFRNAPIRGPISPTRSSTKLMRQISALGMEDPIFCTTEDVPEHPSNIFADMGLDDVPSDMLDLMSVASDPTATHGAGLDESFLQLNLTCFMQTSSSQIDERSFKAPKGHSSKNNMFEAPPQLIEDTSDTSGTARGFSILRDKSVPLPLSKRKIGLIHSQSAAHRIKASQSNQLTSSRMKDGLCVSREHHSFKKPVRQNKDPWNASIPSLDMNGVFSCSNHSSKLDAKADYSSNCAMHDPLLVEAALALQQQHSRGIKQIVEISNDQHPIEKSLLQKQAAATYSPPPKERRVLPTLSGLFSP